MEYGIILALLGIVVLLAMVIMGVHIAIALGVVGFMGMGLLMGFDRAIAMAAQTSYFGIATFDYAVIPLFILMGMLATAVGISTQCYDTLAKWLGRVPGGLGVATTCACAAFGTLNGSALVTASVFSKIAAPEMQRYGYDKYLSYGLCAASGNIGQLIPPSVLIVIYGALTGDSIGRLLMAGIAPGLGLTVMFSLIMVGYAIFRPGMVPVVDRRYTWGEKFRSLPGLIPIAIVAVLIIGGIFFGICSSAEAGAIECLVFFVYAVIYRTPIKKVLESIMDTVQNACMLFLILACSAMFAKFMTVSGMSGLISGWVVNANLNASLFLLGMCVVLLFLGCFLDAYSCIALVIPIFLPAARTLGIDTIHFAMVALIALHMGGLTPPVGLCVYCVKAVAPAGTDVMKIFKGAVPFLIGMIILCLFFIFFPQLSLFIPNAMMG